MDLQGARSSQILQGVRAYLRFHAGAGARWRPHTRGHNWPGGAVVTGAVAITRRARYDVIVVGAGLMGAAAAWSLARRGRSVLVVEQFGPGHRNGSSHGSARIFRRAYADALYVRLSGRAFELWRELEQRSGASILRTLGGIDHGAQRDVDGVAAQLAAAGVPYELLPAIESERRWPGMRFAQGALFQPQAGTIDAALALEALVADAAAHGAQVLYDTTVARLVPGDESGAVELAGGGRVEARALVAAAGAWLEPLLGEPLPREWGKLPRLTVTQQQIFHFPRLDRDAALWPTVMHHAGGLVYHLAGGRDGGPHEDRKIGEHRHGTVTTAAARSGEVDARSRARVVEYVKRWLPGLDPTPGREATCLYTTTPSEDFVLDRMGSLVICSACSGHGAKFAPLIGELVAELVSSPETAQIPARFRLPGRGHRT
ncbi:MAG: FAD-dependent oxidoreductase [Acidobacteriota bacterium]|nr:FAD-dependent oxidoreductase [Acidobacteriota bacterium]